jgi:ATP-binding cassette subfamily C protein
MTMSLRALIRRFSFILDRPVWWKVALALGLTACLGLTEGIGLLMLVPLLQLVGLDVQQGAMGRIAQFLSSAFMAVGLRPTLASVLGAYVLIMSLHGLLSRLQGIVNAALEQDVVASLRTRLYRAIARTSWPVFARNRSADFHHVLTEEAERVGAATSCLLHLCVVTVVTVVYAGLALNLSAVMTGVALASGAGLMLLLREKTRVAQAAGEGLSLAMGSLYAAVTEHLAGMKTARSYGVEHRHAGLFARLVQQVRDVSMRAVRTQVEARYWFDVGTVLLLSLVVYVSVELLTIPTAELLVLIFLFARILPRFSELQQGFQDLASLLPAFASAMEMQARCEAAAERAPQKRGRVELAHAVRFDRVSFGYDGAPVIRDIDLIIRAGRTTAIMGPSGSGKSTIADLVMGLIVPDEGRVLIDGSPLIPERIASWREQIGYVPQETFLFHDTIRANLLWAAPEASEEEIWRALRLAAAQEFVAGLPKGLDTVVGDRGVLLSGGERQRLALARALLRNPTLLILDEATSSLDALNERRILDALEQLSGNVTILIISHRLSALREADLIHVVEEGCLVESKTWDALLADDLGQARALCWQGANGSRHTPIGYSCEDP